MNSCTNIKGLSKWQVAQLKEHLSKHRYYLGEQGIQLDDKELESDFLNSNIEQVGNELRIEYCSKLCPHKEGCELGQFFVQNND